MSSELHLMSSPLVPIIYHIRGPCLGETHDSMAVTIGKNTRNYSVTNIEYKWLELPSGIIYSVRSSPDI